MATTERQQKLKLRMDELERERVIVKQQLDRDRLNKITGDLIETITSPRFIDRMREFRARAAVGASLQEAGDLLSLESLRDAGAEIPADFRLTSRVFEDRETGLRVDIRSPFGDGVGDPIAWGACAGGGAATVCGCAGGST